MSVNNPNYSPIEAKVVSEYIANKSQTAKWQRDVTRTAEKSFQQMTFHNNKAAAKLQRENQAFGMAVNLAALLSEIKLLLHYKLMVEKILEVRAEVDTKTQQRYLDIVADQRNPFPITLPQSAQSVTDYKKNILHDALLFLDSLSEKQIALQTRMIENWGADNWQDGLEKQAQALHEKINARIDNYEFLNVIETPDGSNIDITQFSPAVAENARDTMRAVNNSLKGFINEMPPPTHSPDETVDVVVDDDAPLAPTLDPQTSPKSVTSGRSQATVDLEVFLINEYRKGFGKIGEPLIKEKAVAIDPTTATAVNVNSNIRLALRSIEVVADDLKNIVVKAQKFVYDSHLLSAVNKLVVSAKQDIVKLETDLQATASLRPRSP